MALSKSLASIILAITFLFNALFCAEKWENKWQLNDFPAFSGGVKSSALYDAGSGREPNWKDSDANNKNYMQSAYYVTRGDVRSYLRKLERKGFKKTYERNVEYNSFYGFVKEDKQLYITYNEQLGEARIMDNSCSDRIDEFGYFTAGSGTAAVYQYNFPYYDPDIFNDDEIYSRNGMCYVIKLSDNKLVIIDGGSMSQSAEQNITNFVNFLHEITGTKQGEKINIAMWYGTHAHSDHILVFSKALLRYPDEFNIERLAYNYQSYSNCGYNHRADWFRQQTNEMFPDAKYMKVRTGQKWTLADAEFDVIITHEEVADARTGMLHVDDANECSSVLRVTLNGSTFFFAGDADIVLQDKILERYSEEYLRTDVMQAPHHMLNTDKELYSAVSPTYILAPQSKLRSENYLEAYTVATETVKLENIFFASEGTYCMTPNGDGTMEITMREADYVPYDFSDFQYDFEN